VESSPNAGISRPAGKRRRTFHISRSAGIAAILIYLGHLAMIYMLTQNVARLEQRIQELELENARMARKLEIHKAVETHQRGFSQEEITRICEVIDRESDRYGIDPLLILAVILTESDFKRFEVSEKGAMGLMQIRPSVGRELAMRRGIRWNDEIGLFDPALNVEVGTTYLFELILQFNDITQALAAYAHGQTRLRQELALGRPTPEHYSRRVLSRFDELVAEYRGGAVAQS
jgi:soluble lytic murein transglycosylase-like protein